jgi:hypothetical protein
VTGEARDSERRRWPTPARSPLGCCCSARVSAISLAVRSRALPERLRIGDQSLLGHPPVAEPASGGCGRRRRALGTVSDRRTTVPRGERARSTFARSRSTSSIARMRPSRLRMLCCCLETLHLHGTQTVWNVSGQERVLGAVDLSLGTRECEECLGTGCRWRQVEASDRCLTRRESRTAVQYAMTPGNSVTTRQRNRREPVVLSNGPRAHRQSLTTLSSTAMAVT